MSQPCYVCHGFPEVATTQEQAADGTGTHWIVPRCGHAVCSGCLGDPLDPKLERCSVCNKPLFDFDYSDLKNVKELKPEMEATMHSLRKVHQELNNFKLTSP